MRGSIRPLRACFALVAALTLCGGALRAETYTREELSIPMQAAGPRGLETLLVRPDARGKYPLVIISHGAPRKPEDRERMSPWRSC